MHLKDQRGFGACGASPCRRRPCGLPSSVHALTQRSAPLVSRAGGSVDTRTTSPMESSCALSAPHRKSIISFETFVAEGGGFERGWVGRSGGDREARSPPIALPFSTIQAFLQLALLYLNIFSLSRSFQHNFFSENWGKYTTGFSNFGSFLDDALLGEPRR